MSESRMATDSRITRRNMLIKIFTMLKDLKYSDLTGKIIGCAFEVHKFLGNGFQEVIYQRALAIELTKADLNFARELQQPIFYKDYPNEIGTRRVDFVVEGKVLIELKAMTNIEEVHVAQILNY